MASKFIALTCDVMRAMPPKRIVLSGPSGFLGGRVLECILRVHKDRLNNGLNPGEVVLLSSSPGRLMERLSIKYGVSLMRTVRASRIDYYTQHDTRIWQDQLLSLGLEGEDCVFVNLAAVAGPVQGQPDAMMHVNYRAPVAAASACESLRFGHWIQSSTQATTTERAGQVPYSRGKAMADSALSRMENLPVTIASLGLLYCKNDGVVGQSGHGLNLIDIAMLPLTPIMGTGTAPMQPQEIMDAAERIAFLAFSDPAARPMQKFDSDGGGRRKESKLRSFTFRYYDAVGPETMSILELLEKFAYYRGVKHFRPVHVGYRNFEMLLNVRSLGNLNRQFVSLLRSEQHSQSPLYGNPKVWAKLLGEVRSIFLLTVCICI